MKIVHILNNRAIERDITDNELSFFLSNSNGGFAHFSTSPEPTSKYQGLFSIIGKELYKSVESVRPLADEKVAVVENTGYATIFHRGGFYESFFMPQGKNSLAYEFSTELPVELFLDVRKANDFRQWGRHYELYEKDGIIAVEFTKKTDSREDNSSGNAEYKAFVAVRHDGFVSNNKGEWVKRSYGLDAGRNSASERYVYKAAKVVAKTLVISVAESEAAAIKESEVVFKSLNRLKKASKAHYDGLCNANANGEPAFAANAVRIALDKLKTDKGLYAGLPWFFQEWTRDRLVSCIALPAAARKGIVIKYLDRILDDGRMPEVVESDNSNSPNSNADSIGWLFKRASEMVEKKAFSIAEIRKVKAALKSSIDRVLKSHFRDGFIANEKNETWMDTDFKGDSRKGVCVEIQAMQLLTYNLMHRLSKNRTYLLLEDSLRNNVRKFFWNGSVLADGLSDFTIRPNVFIAAYVYPQLLSKGEWETCISNALERLWLDWGGLSTIDKSHRNFRSSYSGETNESYHRGDSWFWLNNLAAIVMTRVNKRKFKSYIEKIAAASTNDILWKGAIGCGSELSSAKEQRAEGCLNQAWSNATFIELVKNLG